MMKRIPLILGSLLGLVLLAGACAAGSGGGAQGAAQGASQAIEAPIEQAAPAPAAEAAPAPAPAPAPEPAPSGGMITEGGLEWPADASATNPPPADHEPDHAHHAGFGYQFGCGHDHGHDACEIVDLLDAQELTGMKAETEAGFRSACVPPPDTTVPPTTTIPPPDTSLETTTTVDPALVA